MIGYVVYDIRNNQPFDKAGHGHFKVYATKSAANRYHAQWKHRTEVRSVSVDEFRLTD